LPCRALDAGGVAQEKASDAFGVPTVVVAGEQLPQLGSEEQPTCSSFEQVERVQDTLSAGSLVPHCSGLGPASETTGETFQRRR
jgi:hypothetical protein